MSLPRIIARIDVKGVDVIKGMHFDGHRKVGKPRFMAKEYYLDGADEILYMDAVASLFGRNSLFPLVAEAAHDVFVPLTVGGGIQSLDDIVTALRSGADKVAINTAAIKRPAFLAEAVQVFGRQCVVLSIEAKRDGKGSWEALTDYGREHSGKDAVAWAQEAACLGVGEVLITSVDCDGTCEGFDTELISQISERVSIPVIAGGGCGKAAHAVPLFRDRVADAVSCASIFHYRKQPIGELKQELAAAGIEVRL